jgi:hypothetical protein
MLWTIVGIILGVVVTAVALIGVKNLSKGRGTPASSPLPREGQAANGSQREMTSSRLSKIGWGFIIRWMFIPSLVAFLIWGMISCTSSCNSQVKQRVERIPTEGQFRWEQPSEVMIGGRVPDKGICQALVQVDNSNIWQIVLSDNQGRIDHLTWEKSEPYGSWDEVGSLDRGNWWLEKVGRREYRGWITSIKYPGQRLRATLTLRY